MPEAKPNSQPAGVGSSLVRLKDVPLEVRLQALDEVIGTAKTRSEATRLLRLALDPGHTSGRIAA